MSSVYLLRCQMGYLQIDTGYDRDYSAYRRGLDKAGIALGEVKILVLTQYDNTEYIYRFLKAGASGYVLKKAVGSDLVNAGTPSGTGIGARESR